MEKANIHVKRFTCQGISSSKKVKVLIQSHHQFSLSQRHQRDRFDVHTAGQALTVEIAFARFQ